MHKTETLAWRLRALADELESAERFDLPLPPVVSVCVYDGQDAAFHLDDPAEFTAWATYIEADVEEYDYNGRHWMRGRADVLGLHVTVSTTTGAAVSA